MKIDKARMEKNLRIENIYIIRNIIQYGLLVICFAYLCAYMFSHSFTQLDSDIAEQLVMSKQLAQEHTLLSENYCYTTELRVFGYQLIFTPLFYIFNSWHTVRMCGTILLYILMLGSLYYFCKQCSFEKYFGFLGAIYLLPFSEQYYSFFLLNINYIPYFIFMLLGMGMFISQLDKSDSNSVLNRKWIMLIASFTLAFLTGLNGMRQMLILYLPLLLVTVIVKELKLVPMSIGGFAFNLIGLIVNKNVLSKKYRFQQFSDVKWQDFSILGVQNTISGWFVNLGFSKGNLFSIATIQNGVAFVVIFSSLIVLYKLIRRDNIKGKIISLYVIISAMMSLILYSFTNMTYQTRYDLFFMLMIYPLFFLLLQGKDDVKDKILGYGSSIVCGIVLAAVVISGIITYHNQKEIDNTQSLRELSAYLLSNGYKNGYSTFWQANVMTELSNGQIEMWDWKGIGTDDDILSVNRFYAWAQDSRHYDTTPQGKVFWIFTEDEFGAFTIAKNVTEDYIIWDNRALPIDKEYQYVVYGFDSYEDMLSAICAYDIDISESDISPDGVWTGPDATFYYGGYDIELTGENLQDVDVECYYYKWQETEPTVLEITDVDKANSKISFHMPLYGEISNVSVRISNCGDNAETGKAVPKQLKIRRVPTP